MEGGPLAWVTKLKQSMMDERIVCMLRALIQCIETQRFLFELDIAVPCIFHIENRVSEKIIVLILLEGLKYHQIGVGTLSYFKEVEYALNNDILGKEDGN